MTFLRPSRVVISGEQVWLIDHRRPAAAVVASDRSIVRRTWHAESREDERGAVAIADDSGSIVVQDGDRVTWLHIDGTTTSVTGADDLELVAADANGAWLVDGGVPEVPFVDGPAGSVSDLGPAGLIVLLANDGARTEIATPRPVNTINLSGSVVDVVFAATPVLQPSEFGSSVSYPLLSLRVGRDQLLSGVGLEAEPMLVSGSDAPAIDLLETTGDIRWAWMETDRQRVLAGGIPLGDYLWWFGADRDGSAIDRQVLINAYDLITGELRISTEAGYGMVETVARVREELWIVVNRAQLLRVGRDDGVEVLALASDSSKRTVLAPNSIDIADTDPALVSRPTDGEIAEHVAHNRLLFADLEAFWHGRDGDTRPLSDGLSDSHVVVEGAWPNLYLLVRLRHPMRPGLTLQRRFRLYDGQGRPIGLEDETIEIMEDLDTNYLPPAEHAVGGILEF